MNEKGVVVSQKTRGFRSLTGMLILIICVLVSIPTIGLACLGVYYLSQSMDESVEQYEESMLDGYSMEIKSQVQGALSVVQSFYDQSQRGELTVEEAKKERRMLSAPCATGMMPRAISGSMVRIMYWSCTRF